MPWSSAKKKKNVDFTLEQDKPSTKNNCVNVQTFEEKVVIFQSMMVMAMITISSK